VKKQLGVWNEKKISSKLPSLGRWKSGKKKGERERTKCLYSFWCFFQPSKNNDKFGSIMMHS